MEVVETNLVRCSALSRTKPAGVLQLIAILKSCGGTLLRTDYGPIDKNPQRKIDATGSIIGGEGLTHPLLGKGRWHNKIATAPDHLHGTASFSYIHDNWDFAPSPPLRAFTLSQPVDEKDPVQCEAVADGQIAFARILYPQVRPEFGWTDEFGAIDTENVVSNGEIQFLFWSNVFGPELVSQISKDFLLNAPGWKKEELDDGGVLYVVTERYHDWHVRPSQEALQYFQRKMPAIRPYHAKPVELPGEIARMVQIDEATGAETVVYERDGKRSSKPKRKKK